MPPLDLFTRKHVHELEAGVTANLRRYTHAARPWADRPKGVCLPTTLTPAVPLDLVPPDAGGHHDFENSVLLHRAFPDLTPALAADPRLWVRLCHVECWAYMRKRWDVRAFQQAHHAKHPDEGDGKVIRYVRERYFVAGGRPSRALTRNGLARLWWYAALTHDPGRTNPYELTRELTSQLDTAQQLLERTFGRAPHIRTGFLQYLIDAGDALGEGKPRRNHIRHLAKRLNRRGGVTLLDTLGVDGVVDFLAEQSARLRPV